MYMGTTYEEKYKNVRIKNVLICALKYISKRGECEN